MTNEARFQYYMERHIISYLMDWQKKPGVYQRPFFLGVICALQGSYRQYCEVYGLRAENSLVFADVDLLTKQQAKQLEKAYLAGTP